MAATILGTSYKSTSTPSASKAQRWGGLILTGLATLFLLFDLAVKLSGSKQAVDATVALGFQPHHVLPLGVLQAVLLIIYLTPRTAPLGAILWTGYLGGAIATQWRLDNPTFTYILFPVYVAGLLWSGLYLRDSRVRALLRAER